MIQVAPRTTEKLKAYHSQWKNEDLMLARGEGIVIGEGEAWRYEHTGKDGDGKYDLWVRYPDPLEQAGEMTLRDWFAGQALAGIASMSGDGFSLSPEDEARWAYERADAMLATREVKA